MNVTKVCCQGCGADLQIDEGLRYVTCNYCHSKLEVVHDATVTHTRQLDKIERTTDRLVNNLKVIELQNDLEQLDREWASQRDSLMVRGKNGVSKPSTAGSVVGGIITLVFGIIWMSVTASSGAPAFFPLFGFIIIGFAIFSMISGTAKAETYEQEQTDYETRRQNLLSRLERERE